MAAFDTNRVSYDSLGLSGLLSLAFAKIANWRDARETRNALAALSDRELDDIGMCRGDIDTLADGRV